MQAALHSWSGALKGLDHLLLGIRRGLPTFHSKRKGNCINCSIFNTL